MDHIRKAVTKARTKRAQTTAGDVVSGTTTIGSMLRDRVDVSQFPAVSCNFDLFAHNRIISNEHDPVLNSYRVLRTRVLQKMEAEGWRSIAVVSPSPAAGKTVTAINLAIAISSSKDSQVTLMDFDFYRPSVARYMGVENPVSMLDYFEGEKSIEEVSRRTNLPNLLLLSNERVSRRGAEFLSSAKAEYLLDKTVHDYGSRVVVIDTSPVLGCDDTLAFLPQVDCVLLVAASGQTRASDLKETKRLLRNTNIVGTILNKAPKSSVTSNYYYY